MTYSYRRTIHLADTDAAGVVYFATLLHLCHEAYEHCLSNVGFDWQALLDEKTVAIPIVHAEIDFRQPIRWGDRLQICLYPTPLPPSKFQIQYQIYRVPDDHPNPKPLALAQTIHLAIKPQQREHCPLPEQIQEWLKNAPKSGASRN